MCESWLDHIYVNKIKFSRRGALQLLCDFAYVSKWISECGTITQEMRNKMLKNEVLRRCEGVGKLLLRSPGEHIKMNDSSKKPNKSELLLMWLMIFLFLFLQVKSHRQMKAKN